MKNAVRLKRWLSSCLLLTLVGSLGAQIPQPVLLPKQAGPNMPGLLASAPLKEDPKDDQLRKLLKARYNLAFAEMKRGYTAWRVGLSSLEAVTDVAEQLLKSGVELREEPGERTAFLAQFVEMMKEAETIGEAEHKAGMTPHIDVYRVHYLRLDAEIHLARAKREVDKTGDK